MMKNTLASLSLLLVFGLYGCASSKDIHTADGSIVHVIGCQVESLDSCLEEAGEICGTLGYKLVLPDGSPAPAAGTTGAADPGFKIARKVFIQCRP